MRRWLRPVLTFYLPLTLFALPVLFPLYWLITSALKSPGEIFSIPPTWYPRDPSLDGFRAVLAGEVFTQSIRTSLIVAGTSSLLAIGIAVCGGYALARLAFPLRRTFGLSLLFTQLFPAAAILIPLYLFWSGIGMHGTRTALIITYLAQAVPITTWLVKGYVETVPIEMEEQAWIDGATRMQGIVHVILPLIVPAIGATAILAFVGAWDEFIFALTLTGTDPSQKTLPVAMVDFIGQHGVEWEKLMAAATIATVPAVVLFFAAQRFFVRGLTAGAVKG